MIERSCGTVFLVRLLFHVLVLDVYELRLVSFFVFLFLFLVLGSLVLGLDDFLGDWLNNINAMDENTTLSYLCLQIDAQVLA